MGDDDIAAHYELGLEDRRLFTGGQPRLEYLRTMELIGRFVPAGAHILDVGGGTGVYAVPLAHGGHRVELVDLMARHVADAAAAAQARGLSDLTATVGDARRLEQADGSVDAVLLLGPLYHLVDRDERVQALREAHRVLRPGGVVLAAAISRHASLLSGLADGVLGDPVFQRIVEQDLVDGQHRNPDIAAHPHYFTTAFFHLPEELVGELEAAGFADVGVLAVEGPGWLVERTTPMAELLLAARSVEADPHLLSASAHLLGVGHRPGSG